MTLPSNVKHLVHDHVNSTYSYRLMLANSGSLEKLYFNVTYDDLDISQLVNRFLDFANLETFLTTHYFNLNILEKKPILWKLVQFVNATLKYPKIVA